MMREPISVTVLADIRLYREGLRDVLDGLPGITVADVAAVDQDGVQRAIRHRPDVAVVDMAMPLGTLIARTLADAAPETKVVGLGVSDTESRVLACAEAGLVGYVSREGGIDELVSVIRRAARGEAFYSPRIVALLLQHLAQRGRRRTAPADRLTARELEVAELINHGLTNKEIAERLFIEVATVKNHVHHILEKLHLRRRIEVANWIRVRRADRTDGRPDRMAVMDPSGST